jgi:hypothetical protein
MKVHIMITDDDGTVFAGDLDLAPSVTRARRNSASARAQGKVAPRALPAKLDFTKSERAFVKAHASGLSGARKFVLLVAYLAKAVVGKEVQLNEVQKRWNKMTSAALLGCKFNRFYSNTAKDDGWVDTRKKGIYVLTPAWKNALE